MYLRLVDGMPVKFFLGYLRIENPNTSFPERMSDEFLAGWGVYRYEEGLIPEYNQETQVLKLGKFYKDDSGKWKQGWNVIQVNYGIAISNVRSKRDKLLSDTDWVIAKHAEAGETVPTKWVIYRQSLRDITAQEGFPYSVNWPTKP